MSLTSSSGTKAAQEHGSVIAADTSLYSVACSLVSERRQHIQPYANRARGARRSGED